MRISYIHACIVTELGNFDMSLTLFHKAKSLFEFAQKEDSTINQTRLSTYLGGVANSLNGLGLDEEAETFYLECFRLSTLDEYNSAYQINICRSYWSRGLLEKASTRLCELIKLRDKRFGECDKHNYL
jgi:tetratricopeptide (TPR) repeat protein